MYKNADFEKFNKLIRQFNWEESFFTLVNDIDEMADFFTNKYLEMAKEKKLHCNLLISKRDLTKFHYLYFD
jgi:hypothetical protein